MLNQYFKSLGLKKSALFDLLDAEKNTGLTLTDSFAMSPAAAVSGWYFAHPDSKYFGLGKVNEEQIRDISERKGLDYDSNKKWYSSVSI